MANLNEKIVVENNLFTLIMWVARYCGLAPVRLSKTYSCTTMSISRSWQIYGYIFIVIYHALYIFFVYYEYDEQSELSNNKSIGTKSFFYFIGGHIFLTTLIVAYATFYGLKRTRVFMYAVDQTQKIKKIFALTNDLKTKKKWDNFATPAFWIFFVWTLALWTLDFWVYDSWYNTSKYFVNIVYIFLSLLEFQFIVVAMSLKSALSVLNENLQELLTKIHLESEIDNRGHPKLLRAINLKIPISSVNVVIDRIGVLDPLHTDTKHLQRISIAQRVRQTAHSFVSISDICRQLNNSESVILLFRIAIFSIDLIITIFNILTLFTNADFTRDNYNRLLQISWLLYHLIKTLMLVEPCCRTQEEVSNMQYLVGRFMCDVTSNDDPLRDEVDDFFKLLMIDNISYSMLGICKVGRPLISTIVGAITTVLVL